MPYRQIIAEAYDAGVEEEFSRLTENPLREAEYHLIAELLDEYIADGATVIDIGSGPGRYAEHLLSRNCKVGLVDLSARSLKTFSDRVKDSCRSKNIIFNKVACATQLDWIATDTADAVLLMGPLYHLIYYEHQRQALNNCYRILKQGGYLFSVFLSPFPEVADIPQYGSKESEDAEEIQKLIPASLITHTGFKGYKVAQFRCRPSEARDILLKSSFETLRIRNLEGKGSFIPAELLATYNTPFAKARLLNYLRSTSEIDTFSGITHQFVTVSRKQA